jgi:DNA-binding GntR family transcriptional regulator
MKQDTVFKRAFNRALDLVSALPPGEPLPSESRFGRDLAVSRTTVRKVLVALDERGVIEGFGTEAGVRVAQHRAVERFPESETISKSQLLERAFMDWIVRDNAQPGMTISESELARRFGVGTSGIREFLNRFEHYGLIEKRPNAGWLFKGFTSGFALELFEIREIFEVRSAAAFGALTKASPNWKKLAALRDEHLALLADIDNRYHDFSDLDSRFHRLINSAAPNRFVDDFYDIISLIFHYHYQWNKRDERQRNEVAIREHLTYIAALEGRNIDLINLACRAHLASAKETLIRSTSGDSGRTGPGVATDGRRKLNLAE